MSAGDVSSPLRHEVITEALREWGSERRQEVSERVSTEVS